VQYSPRGPQTSRQCTGCWSNNFSISGPGNDFKFPLWITWSNKSSMYSNFQKVCIA